MDISTIKHISRLSYLEFTEEEMVRFAEELSAIVNYVSDLEKAPTEGNPRTQRAEQSSYDGVPASDFSRVSLSNAFRSDKESLKENLDEVVALLKAAPEREDGYVKVKAIL